MGSTLYLVGLHRTFDPANHRTDLGTLIRGWNFQYSFYFRWERCRRYFLWLWSLLLRCSHDWTATVEPAMCMVVPAVCSIKMQNLHDFRPSVTRPRILLMLNHSPLNVSHSNDENILIHRLVCTFCPEVDHTAPMAPITHIISIELDSFWSDLFVCYFEGWFYIGNGICGIQFNGDFKLRLFQYSAGF